MHFNSNQFLGFFCVVYAVYWILPRHSWRLLWLLLASCRFYMSWNPWLISLIVFSASIDYVVALRLPSIASPAKRRFLLLASISVNLGLLGYFKYMNFFLDSTYTCLGWLGMESHHCARELILPLGISFYTFETISYVVDVYHGRIEPVRNLRDYALYIMFFPHLVAGPIVRPRDFLPQIRRRKRFNWDRLQLGVQFFLLGLFKKAVIADHLAAVADPIFKSPAGISSQTAWLAALAYAMQIYCDFSGYSDMAVGLAHMFGFRLPANFNMPYFAVNITEFWRRWHISLSSWLRDYLYIPMGGSRGSSFATYRNLLVTMLLGGLWHGANWTFICWGGFHGLLLALHRAASGIRWLPHACFRFIGVPITFVCVTVGWVLFRSQTLTDASTILSRMFWPTAGTNLTVTNIGVVALCLWALLAGHLAGTLLDVRKIERRVPAALLGGTLALLFLMALLLQPVDGKGFIYFQF